ncbi:putative gustatory receptor 28a isoform X2 [Photinus pyralis]|nr:putative gustatory receptor 28a isoform X2 [Photinus pyralis]
MTYIVGFVYINKERDTETGYITKLTAELYFYCANIGVWIGICIKCIFAGGVANIVRDIDNFDKQLHWRFKNDIVKIYRKTVILIYGTIALVVVFMANYIVCISFLKRYKTLLLSFGALFVNIGAPLTSTITVFQFSAVVMSLRSRFRLLNARINSISTKLFFRNAPLFTIYSRGTSKAATNMIPLRLADHKIFNIFEDLRNKHNDLCRICRDVNTCYSLEILMIVLQNFISLILSLYFGGKSIFHKRESSAFIIYNYCNQLFLATVQTMVLVLICTSTVAEARKTGDLIHNAVTMQEPCNESMYLQASLFSLQLMHSSVQFTACGVFPIDASLLLSILGAITTYLVIVVQFEISYPRTDSNSLT